MKFVALSSNIREAIGVVERARGDIANLPILKNVLIDAQEGGVTFMATNLEIAVTTRVSGKVIESGKVTVPLSLFSNLITNLQSDRINFESKGNKIEIKTDNYSATIEGVGADEFPITPKVKKEDGYIDIKNVFLKEAIQQASVAAQYSEIRPELNSILFDFSVENLKIAATDGFRLAEKIIPSNLFTAKNIEPFRMLVPLKTAGEAARIFSQNDTVRIYYDESQVLFRTERAELISRLIEGAFPDYSQLIPKKFFAEIVVKREEFANAVKLTSVFGQKNNETTISIRQDKKTIAIHSADQSLGENDYLIPAKIKGEPGDIIFNWRYLADAIKAIATEELFIGIQEDAGPALIKPSSDISYFYILKPIMKG